MKCTLFLNWVQVALAGMPRNLWRGGIHPRSAAQQSQNQQLVVSEGMQRLDWGCYAAQRG
jgi:hypothetical protein